MEKQRWLDPFGQPGGDGPRIQAACELVRQLDDPEVMDRLVRTALHTRNRELRTGVLAAPRFSAGQAGGCLAEAATRSKDPMIRRQAFVCLRRLGCRTALEAVTKGLRDPSPPVQRAAALNVGLYDNPVLWEAFRTFVRHNHNASFRECCRLLWEALRDWPRFAVGIRKAVPKTGRHPDALPAEADAPDSHALTPEGSQNGGHWPMRDSV